MGTVLFHADRREAISRFSQFCEKRLKMFYCEGKKRDSVFVSRSVENGRNWE